MNRDIVLKELETQGYSVIPNVLKLDECDKYINQYKEWLHKFGSDRPYRDESLIHHFRTAHSEPAWQVRLKSKPVFAELWETDKLLTSMDGIAIEEPPELGRASFGNPDTFWFHTDQGSWREGLHAYQGAVYLEETTEQDFCFRVLENSVLYHKEFYDTFPNAKVESGGEDFYMISKEHVDWYISKGCKIKKVPVPKGGMVLWDSRTIHDNQAPMSGRSHTDRWRFVIMVCMVPAIWATKEDIELKKEAFNEMVATAHWPAQGVWLFKKTTEREITKRFSHLEMIEKQPDIAKTKEIQQLIGIEIYIFNDEDFKNLNFRPKWTVDDTTYRNRQTKQQSA